jgi:hypothetical protein
MGELGPYHTHLTALENLDGRTKEARILKSMRRELKALLGHTPNAGEIALIERLAWLQLRLSVLDRRLIAGEFTQFDASVYNAHVNSFARGLQKLGAVGKPSHTGKPERTGKPALTVADILAKRVA